MTFSFDDGQSVPVETRLQLGIISRLQPLLYQEGDAATNRGPYLRTLLAIPQVPDDEFMEANRSDYMVAAPGVLVFVGGGMRSKSATLRTGRQVTATRTVQLILFSATAGDAVDGRLDETERGPVDTRNDPGIRVLKQHVIERLHGARPLDGMSTTLQFDGDMPLETRPDWTTWGVLLSIDVDYPVCADDARNATAIDRIRTRHNAQGGEVAQQIQEVT